MTLEVLMVTPLFNLGFKIVGRFFSLIHVWNLCIDRKIKDSTFYSHLAKSVCHGYPVNAAFFGITLDLIKFLEDEAVELTTFYVPALKKHIKDNPASKAAPIARASTKNSKLWAKNKRRWENNNLTSEILILIWSQLSPKIIFILF